MFNPIGLFTDSSATSILSVLYSGVSPSTAVSTGNPITDLKLAQANQTIGIAREAKLPEVARDIAAFQKAVSGATSPTAALSNPNVMKVLLTANNLAKYIDYPALARKALLSDPADPKSLANNLSDASLKAATKTYNFAKNGLAVLKNRATLVAITHAYAEVLWRKSLDIATPGLANALTFQQQARSITSVDQILGDPTNRAVVLGALGIPPQVAFQPLTTQEQAVASRLKIEDFQKPAFVTSLTDRYLLSMQDQAPPRGGDLLSLAVRSRGLTV